MTTSMLLETVLCLLFAALMTLGPGRPWAARLGFDPAETLVAGAVLSLIVVWGAGWALYVTDAPPAAVWFLPALALAGLAAGRRGLGALVRDPDARGLAVGQILVTGWCVGWLAFTPIYSVGTWAGDWLEHWERTLFFLDHWPRDHRFIGLYDLSARPPLANVLTAVLLGLTRDDYPHYQVFMAVLSSLSFLPAALLARRFGGRAAPAILAALVLVNPLFAVNATFPWTKLPAAFFILTGLYFFLRARDGGPKERASCIVCGLSLAGGILTHYSAAPYAVVLGVAWIALGRNRGNAAAFTRTTVLAAAAAAAVLLSWFGWSVAVYGAGATFLSNTSVTSLKDWQGSQAEKLLLNLRDTLVPHFLRPMDRSLIEQTSPWGLFHDWCFEAYQSSFPFALGSVAWLAVVREAVRAGREAAPRDRWFWIASVSAMIVLGVAVHGDRDAWGLAQICLQALVLAGLAFLAARWDRLGRGWRRAVIAGGLADLTLGVALQFAVQDFALDRWLAPERNFNQACNSYSTTVRANIAGKIGRHLVFFSDLFTPAPVLVLALLAVILMLALLRARRFPARTPPDI